jgi:hypothetical protein
VYSSNPREGGYIELAIHEPLWAVQGHMGHSHIYTLTPPAVWTTGATVYKTGQQRKKLIHKSPVSAERWQTESTMPEVPASNHIETCSTGRPYPDN